MKYLLKRGRFSRYEKGVLRKYKINEEVELSDKEAARMKGLIGPVDAPASTAPPVMRHVVPVPASATKGDFSPPPSPEAMSDTARDDIGATTSPFERGPSFYKRSHRDDIKHDKD